MSVGSFAQSDPSREGHSGAFCVRDLSHWLSGSAVPRPTDIQGPCRRQHWIQILGCGVLGKVLLSYSLVHAFKKAGFEAAFNHFTHKLLPLLGESSP